MKTGTKDYNISFSRLLHGNTSREDKIQFIGEDIKLLKKIIKILNIKPDFCTDTQEIPYKFAP